MNHPKTQVHFCRRDASPTAPKVIGCDSARPVKNLTEMRRRKIRQISNNFFEIGRKFLRIYRRGTNHYP